MSLGRQAFFASVWSLAGNGGRQLIAFVLFIFIARKLTPADIGLVAFAMILIELLGFASRMGQVEALQRQPTLPDKLLNTSFWLLAVTGLLVTAAVAAVAWFLRDIPTGAAVSPILMLLAPLCALQAWNAVPEALLKQRFDYKSLATRTWTATLAGGIAGAYLAISGYGVYALVGQRLVTALFQSVVVWMITQWRPRFIFDRVEAARLLRSGGGILMASLAGQLNKRIVDTITGAMLGLSDLGHFRLGWRFFDFLTQFAVTPMTAVALSVFSSIQKDRPRLVRTYLRMTQLAALGSFAAFFGLGAIADVMVPVLLGDKWSESIIVIQLLGFVMLGGTINYFFAPVLIAVGRVQVVVRQSMAQIVGTALFVFCGTYFGLIGVVVAIIVRAMMVAVYNVAALRKEIGLSVAALMQALLPPLVASGFMVIAVRLAKAQFEQGMPGIVLLPLLVVIGAVTYVVALFAGDLIGAWRGYLRDSLDTVLRALARRGGESTPLSAA